MQVLRDRRTGRLFALAVVDANTAVRPQRRTGQASSVFKALGFLLVVLLAGAGIWKVVTTPDAAPPKAAEAKPKAKPGKAKSDTDADRAANVADRPPSGDVLFGPPGHQELVKWQHVQPVLDNRAAFAKYFPDSEYAGDVGDQVNHQQDPVPQDHTPRSVSVYNGNHAKEGWIYAQDFGIPEEYWSNPAADAFNEPLFTRWLVRQCRAGKYPEVKYIISRHALNRGTSYYGIFMRANGWRAQSNSDHEHHIHISYMMSPKGSYKMEKAHSTIIADYWKWRQANPRASINNYN